jgi:deoxyinosine 3'endonuclease (endonuclease V)
MESTNNSSNNNNNNNSNETNENKHGKTKFEELISLKDPEILENWRKEQDELKSKLIKTDFKNWNLNNDPNNKDNYEELKYIGGVDISASKHNPNIAVSALVICDRNLKIVYEDYKVVEMKEPYIPGFLAFREVNHLVNLINELKNNSPEYVPQVILVDGNGILHTKGFGLASHLGVLVDIPTIGCSKTVFSVDGINKKKVKDIAKKNLIKGGDYAPLIGDSGIYWGYALKSNDECTNPMIISIGHKISNETALKIVQITTMHRIPQPIRLSDKISRRLIVEYENFINKNPGKEWDLKKYLKDNYDKLHSDLDD